ncbi:unnamed protein product, partial [Staurois parvus]
MPLVPFFIGFFEFGQGHRGPMIPYCPGPHELSVRPCSCPLVLPISAHQCRLSVPISAASSTH